MKSFNVILCACALALVASVRASDTYTTRTAITKPAIGSAGWGTKVNDNYDLIDSTFATLAQTNIFTAANTFTKVTTFTATVNGTNLTLSGILTLNGSLSAPLAIAYGGTGQNWGSVTTGRMPYFASTGVMTTLAAGTTNYILRMNGGVPNWVNPVTSVAVASSTYATGAGAVPASGVTAGTLATNVLISTVPALDGSQLTGLAAANVAAGTFGTGVLISTVPALDGHLLTNLTGANVSGTVPLASSCTFSSFSGNASTVTNGVYTTGSYANPTWITSLAASKVTGLPSAGSSIYPATATASFPFGFTAGVSTFTAVIVSSATVAPQIYFKGHPDIGLSLVNYLRGVKVWGVLESDGLQANSLGPNAGSRLLLGWNGSAYGGSTGPVDILTGISVTHSSGDILLHTSTAAISDGSIYLGSGKPLSWNGSGYQIKVSTSGGVEMPSLTVNSVAFSSLVDRQLTSTIGDGASVISTGTRHIPIRIPYNMTITSWSIDQAVPTTSTGSVKVAILKYSSYPSASSYIVGSSTPTMTSAYTATSSTLTGWTTSLSKGDVLDFVVQTSAVAKRIVLNIIGVAR